MNQHLDRIQIVLGLIIAVAGAVMLVSIPVTRSITIFIIAGRVGLLALAAFTIYTGYINRGKTPAEAGLLVYRSPKSMIRAGIIMLLFVLLTSLQPVLQGYMK